MSWFAKYQRVNDWLAKILYIFASAIIAFIVIALFASAATRYLTGIGYDWLVELPPQLVPWVVFPLLGALIRTNDHLTVDVVPHFLRASGTQIIRILVAAICLVVSLVFLAAGYEAVAFFRQLNQLSATEIEFPLWWLYVAFPVGFALAANFSFEVLVVEIARMRGFRTAAETNAPSPHAQEFTAPRAEE